ncbi:MAG: hypothetical protein LUH55_06595, partial [Bacteroides thetaiotaomicron]|nr:hypothetical protein [Bacteroides thetaiotaomicron]
YSRVLGDLYKRQLLRINHSVRPKRLFLLILNNGKIRWIYIGGILKNAAKNTIFAALDHI